MTDSGLTQDAQVADRLETLEVKVAHLERGLQELSDVVVRQQRELEQAREHGRQIAAQLAALREGSEPGSLEDEIPPHY